MRPSARRRRGETIDDDRERIVSSPSEEKKSHRSRSRRRVRCVRCVLATTILLGIGAAIAFAVCDSCRQHAPYRVWLWGQDRIAATSSSFPFSMWRDALIFVFGDPRSARAVAPCGSPAQRPQRAWMTGGGREGPPRPGSPLFVVGCAHSGTTALARMIGRHPNAYLAENLPASEYSVTPHSFGEDALFFFGGAIAFRRRDDVEFDRLARARGASIWVVKSPSNVCRLGYVWDRIPNARAIVIVRDGRDVYLSLRARYPEDDPSGENVLKRWVRDTAVGLRRADDDERAIVVRFEDLATSPERVLRDVFAHAGLSATEDVVRDAVRFDALSRDGREAASTALRALRRIGRSDAQIAHDAARETLAGTSVPRWPHELTSEDEKIIRGDRDALRLLVRLGYVAETETDVPWVVE